MSTTDKLLVAGTIIAGALFLVGLLWIGWEAWRVSRSEYDDYNRRMAAGDDGLLDRMDWDWPSRS